MVNNSLQLVTFERGSAMYRNSINAVLMGLSLTSSLASANMITILECKPTHETYIKATLGQSDKGSGRYEFCLYSQLPPVPYTYRCYHFTEEQLTETPQSISVLVSGGVLMSYSTQTQMGHFFDLTNEPHLDIELLNCAPPKM
jgi:hypothetical protein